MSINDISPEEWDKMRQPECELTRPEVPYAPSPDGYDSVERPMHYDGQVECIEYIRDRLGHEGFIAYCWGSVIKYQHRWKEKGGIESLRKARWFLNRLIQEEATGRFDG